METSVLTVITAFLSQAPMFTVWVIGFIMAIKLKPRNPRKAQLIMASMAIFILQALFDTVMNVILPKIIGYESMGWAFGVKGFLSAIVMTVGWILILWALFSPARDSTTRNN